ncbi:MAG: pyridoxamine 5'-phosphate oxidase family protein [Thermomicrobiales bacterium]
MAENPGTSLSAEDLKSFLEGPHTARLACIDEGGRPYIVPVWHEWDGERFWVIASERAQWVHHLLDRPSVALSIDEPDTATRVLCQGHARYVEGPVEDGAFTLIALRMAARYLGEASIPDYRRNTAGMRRWLFAIDVDRLVSWRGAGTTN